MTSSWISTLRYAHGGWHGASARAQSTPMRSFFRAGCLTVAMSLFGCSSSPGTVFLDSGGSSVLDVHGTGMDAVVSSDSNVHPPSLDVVPIDVHGVTDVPARDVVSAYDTGVAEDVVGCDIGGVCHPVSDNCGPTEVCNNGADDNCNGQVDENCPCIPSTVQSCFLGPPGRRHVGACSDGAQTCQGVGEFGTWGPCQGGIWPSVETCNGLDNNCNGCVGEGLCCNVSGSCPGPGDPRIPVGHPYTDYPLLGRRFYPGPAELWHWEVTGGPCDQMLYATSGNVSYTLNGGAGNRVGFSSPTDSFILHATLSGDYTVTMTVTIPGGTTFTCTFIVQVRAPGLRVELCWDTTGQDDLDLWLHDPRNTNPFGAHTNTDTCAWYNCPNPVFPGLDLCSSNRSRNISWGYADVPGVACRQPDGTACHSPRLDIDNINCPGVPENINVDAPTDGQNFRVAVNYYGAGFGTGHTVHPMVNIYCGGALQATYGGADAHGMHFGASPVDGFNTPGADATGSFWRVTDVTMHPSTCDLHPIHPVGTSAGSCVQTGTDRTYNGGCQVMP